MKIDINEIKFHTGTSMHVDELVKLPDFDLSHRHVELPEPLHLDVEVTNTGDNFLVMGRLTADTVVECDRCLERFVLPLDIEFYQEVEKDALDNENIIDLTDSIYEHLTLEQPIRALCKEECRGLCPKCGQNLNEQDCGCDRQVIDPRLVKLQDFFKKD